MKETLRKETFPFFKNNPKITYLDSSLTTIKPKEVIDSISSFYSFNLPTIDRSNNKLTKASKDKFILALHKIAKFINAKSTNEIIPVAGTTDGLNRLAFSIPISFKFKKDDEVILGEFEHASNYLPWLSLSKMIGIKIKHYKLDENFNLDFKHLKSIVNSKTKLIAISHVYNSIGVLNDIAKVKATVGKNVLVLVDAAQSIGHLKIDVQKLDCDFLVFGGHKMFGPNGIGICYMKEEHALKLVPFNLGGGMFTSYSLEHYIFQKLPVKFWGGTPNVTGIVALGAAVDFINKIGIDKIQKHNENLKDILEKELSKIENIIILNPKVKSSILLFKVKGINAEDVNYKLQNENIFLRSGYYCVNNQNKLLNTNEQSLRVSFHYYNNEEDLNKFLSVMKKGGDFLDGLFNAGKDSKCS